MPGQCGETRMTAVKTVNPFRGTGVPPCSESSEANALTGAVVVAKHPQAPQMQCLPAAMRADATYAAPVNCGEACAGVAQFGRATDS